jgi:hypothetical protein
VKNATPYSPPPPSLKSSFIIVKKVVSFFSLCGTGEKENQKGEKESNELKEKRTTVVMNVCVCKLLHNT